MRLGHIDHMVHRHTYPEDHPKVKCGNSHFHDHAIVSLLGYHVETQFPYTHLSSYPIDSLLLLEQPMTEFLGFFREVQDPGHFVEHLLQIRFSESLHSEVSSS